MTAATNDSGQPLLETLRKVNLFSALDEDILRLLQTKMQRMTFQPGEILCREGEAADRMYVIESGEISVLKTGPEGEPAELTVLPALFVPSQPTSWLPASLVSLTSRVTSLPEIS